MCLALIYTRHVSEYALTKDYKKKGILENTLFLVITLEAHKEFSLMGNGFSCVLD